MSIVQFRVENVYFPISYVACSRCSRKVSFPMQKCAICPASRSQQTAAPSTFVAHRLKMRAVAEDGECISLTAFGKAAEKLLSVNNRCANVNSSENDGGRHNRNDHDNEAIERHLLSLVIVADCSFDTRPSANTSMRSATITSVLSVHRQSSTLSSHSHSLSSTGTGCGSRASVNNHVPVLQFKDYPCVADPVALLVSECASMDISFGSPSPPAAPPAVALPTQSHSTSTWNFRSVLKDMRNLPSPHDSPSFSIANDCVLTRTPPHAKSLSFTSP
eukprot:ANDGO_03611.mRNA.1 hypothetical protein